MLTIGSLFSGIGGFEIGLEAAGLGPVLWQVEIDPFARSVLARHWPGVVRYGDVREVGRSARGTMLPITLESVDIICAGFPCQDVSLAGHRVGLGGSRSGLWFEALRIVGEIRPRFVLIENVRGLIRRGLDVVVGGLCGLGYEVAGTRIRAADVGAPHRRERLLLAARMADDDRERLQFFAPRNGEKAGMGLASGRDPARCGADGRRQRSGLGRPQPRMVRGLHGLSPGVDRWPAGPGQEPRESEPSRTIPVGSDPLWARRIAGLGNAIVPAVAYVGGRLIAKWDAEDRARRAA